MAEALFTATSLEPQECEKLAAAQGLALPAFRACVAAPETDQRLDADVAWMQQVSPGGLPVVWVQDRMIVGLHGLEVLRAAFQKAEARLAGKQDRPQSSDNSVAVPQS